MIGGPYIAAAVAVVWTGTLVAAYRIGGDVEYAVQAREDRAVTIASDAAASAAAHAISKLEVRRVEITSKAQTVVREVPVYADCKHDRRMLDNINAARGVAASSSELPSAGRAD